MKQIATAKPQQELVRELLALSAGPVLLDMADFKSVSGGSPKGTWCVEGAECLDAAVESPKGTW